MAVNSVLTSNSMVIKYKVGVDPKGNDKFREQRFKGLSTKITDEKIVALSDGLGKLLDYSVGTIKKEQSYIITKGVE